MATSTKRVYSAKKSEMLNKLAKYNMDNNVIAVSKIRKVRASQMMLLRKNFRKELSVIVVKNKIAKIGLKSSNNDMEKFIDQLTDQNALIFTNMNPFKLQLMLDKNKIILPARSGDIATEDIIIPAGNTGIPPGPVLSEFKELKVATKIDAGNISVNEDTVVLRTGEQVSPKLAGMLARLSIKPIKAGLSLSSAYTNGLIFTGQNLHIDLDEYRRKINEVHGNGLRLGVNSLYYSEETTPLILGKALLNAKSLSITSAYLSADTIRDVIAFNEKNALAILNLAKIKNSDT
ncbi:MAG TPA: 50S ribosomal protein L10 [Nitrososphaerales archaeon]